MKLVLVAMVVAACGSSPPPKRPDPRPPGPGSGATPTAAATCDDACTQYAVCYEQVYAKDYSGGGECVTSCDEMAEPDKTQYIAEWTASDADCAKLMGQ